MAIPKVDRSTILNALEEFDTSLRNSEQWAGWDQNKTQVWVLVEGDKRYPPKKIVAMASGISVNDFSGGSETNAYLEERGFTVGRLRELGLDDTYRLILERYHEARANQSFGGNHEIKELFANSRRLLEEAAPVKGNDNIRVVSSYGKGNWATIPWISLLDRRETETTQEGTYVVYLFREDGQGVYVKLAQGVTAAEKKYGSNVISMLAQDAEKVRVFCKDLGSQGFDLSGKSDLGVDQRMARLYEASTIASKYYPRDAIPPDGELINDLRVLLGAYNNFVENRTTTNEQAPVARPLALLGTWRSIRRDASEISEIIAKTGAWASWWSFPIRAEAKKRLVPPFHLYAYVGDSKLAARLTVDDYVTSNGNAGIESPWPEATEAELRGKPRLSEKLSEIFKTWFKISKLELFDSPLLVTEFESAIGLSTQNNLLSQSSFGYLLDNGDAVLPLPLPAKPLPMTHEINWLVDRTGLKREFLQEIVDSILSDSPQVMLAGPPGTSKTWVARQLALYLARGRQENVRFVQFHPSYSYESFIEGLRPVTRSSGVAFELTPGVVRESVAQMMKVGAINQTGNEYVIVVDEANRANLPRVLGELMFLFEYRNEPIRLQYSAEVFQLPSNLRFIATMNTADRSIRSIDIALRRRFDVFEFQPDPAILAAHYATGRLAIDGLVEGFLQLNQSLTTQLDRHHTIGHAFFMRDSIPPMTLRQIWGRRIFPLIEEFFFDQPELAIEYTVERFWPALNAQ